MLLRVFKGSKCHSLVQGDNGEPSTSAAALRGGRFTFDDSAALPVHSLEEEAGFAKQHASSIGGRHQSGRSSRPDSNDAEAQKAIPSPEQNSAPAREERSRQRVFSTPV